MSGFRVSATIQKSTEKDGAVRMYGWAAMSRDDLGEPVIDSDGEYIPIDELERAAQTAFLRRGGKGSVGVMHDDFAKADLVESFVLSAEKRSAFGLGDGPQGWMVGLVSRDPEVVRLVKSGAMLELSIRGFGRTERVRYPKGARPGEYIKAERTTGDGEESVGVIRELELADVELLSIVDRGASANERVRSRIVLIKRNTEEGPMPQLKKRSPQAILADLFEQGKLADLDPAEKEALLTLLGSAPSTSISAPEAEPAAEEMMSAEGAAEEEMPKAADGAMEEEKAKRERDALLKANQRLSERVQELEKRAQRAEVVDLVKRDMAYFPGASVDDLADVVQEVRLNLGADMVAKVEGMLKSASEVCKSSDLFKAAGVRKGGGTAGSADEELLALAKSKRDADPKLSQHEAIMAAGRERPDLWAKRQGAVRR